MRTSAALALAAYLVACGSTGANSSEKPSFAKTLPLDDNGVRVADGETSDLRGGGNGPLDLCGDVETERLSLDEARQLQLPVEDEVTFLQNDFQAPFRWSFGCDAAGYPLEEQDAHVRLHGEIVDVYRTRRAPLPNQSIDEQCSDRLSYRFVFDLSTDDGQVSGRFYARTPRFPGAVGLVVEAAPDLRNFDGKFTLPIDLSRPHWAALRVGFAVRDDTGALEGSILPLLNYSDDEITWDGLGTFGAVPAPDEDEESQHLNPDCRFTPPAALGSEPITLSAYDRSQEIPTCPVAASYWVSDSSLEQSYYARDFGAVKVEVDGISRFFGWGVPQSLGRLPNGAHVRVEVQSRVPGGIPFAALQFGTGNGYDALD